MKASFLRVLTSITVFMILIFQRCSAQCPAAFPKVISGKQTNGITTVQSIQADRSQQYLIAGGYSNEFESAITSDFYPWIARFKITRISADPVMDWGLIIKGLPNYQVLSTSFDRSYSQNDILMQLKPINCISGSQLGYVMYFGTFASPPWYRARKFNFQKDCTDQDDYLNTYLFGSSHSALFGRRIQVVPNKVFQVDSLQYQSSSNTQNADWSIQSSSNYHLLGIDQGDFIFIFSSNISCAQQIILSQVGFSSGQHFYSQALDLYYSEAPLLTQVIAQSKVCIATKLASGGFQFAIVNIDSIEDIQSIQQFKLTQTGSFNSLKLRGMNLETSSERFMYLLLLNTASRSDLSTHVIQVDTSSLQVYFFEQTLPLLTPAASPNLFISKAYFYSWLQYFIGLSIQGGIVKKDNSGQNIGSTSSQVSSLILTNQQTVTCQTIDKLDSSLPPINDLSQISQYVFTKIPSPTSGFGALPSIFSSATVASYTNDNTVVSSFVTLNDAMATENVDASCQLIGIIPIQNSPQILSGTTAGVQRTFTLNLQFQSNGIPGCPASPPSVYYSVEGTIAPNIGVVSINSNDLSFTTQATIQVTFQQDYSFKIRAYCNITQQVALQSVDVTISNYPPFFVGYKVGSNIGSHTMNIQGKQITLPQVDYSHDTYADLSINPPSTDLQVTTIQSKVDSSNSQLIVSAQPIKPYVFKTYEVSLKLSNDEGSFTQPYIISITLVDSPHTFTGFNENANIDSIKVKQNKELIFNLPPINNIYNTEAFTVEIIDPKSNQALSFAETQGSSTQVIFSPKLNSQVGTYTLTVKLINQRGLFSTYQLLLEVEKAENLGPPVFSPPLVQISCKFPIGQQNQISLPQITDPDDTDQNPSVQLSMQDTLIPFIKLAKLDSGSYNISVNVPASQKKYIQLGKAYTIKVILNDQNQNGPKESKYNLIVEFNDPDAPVTQAQIINKMNYTNSKNNTVTQQKRNFIWPKVKSSKPLSAKISDMNSQGVVTIRYSDKIGNNSIINENVLEVKVKQNPLPGNKTIISWNVTEVSAFEHILHIEFAQPGDISNDKMLDYLSIRVINNETIFRVKDNDTLIRNYQMNYQIPRQIVLTSKKSFLLITLGALKRLMSVTKSAQLSMMAAIITNVVLQVFLSFSMQFVWGMLNTLQLISFTTQYSLLIPDNVFSFFQVVNDLLNMKAKFIKDWINDTLEKIIPSRGEGESMLQSMETLLVIGIVLAIGLLVVGILSVLVKYVPIFQKLYEVLKKKLLYNSILRFGLQSYLKLAVPAITGLQHLDFVANKSKAVNSSVTLTIFLALSLYPIWTLYFMMAKGSTLSEPQYAERYNSLYLTLNTDLKASLYSTTFFLVRRFVLAIIYVYLSPSHQYFQIVITMIVSGLIMTYQVKFSPLKSKILNYLELYNEVTFQLTTLILLAFTDYTPDPDMPSSVQKQNREGMGWVFVSITGLYVAINLIFIVKDMGYGLYQKVKTLISQCKDKLMISKAQKYNMFPQQNLTNPTTENKLEDFTRYEESKLDISASALGVKGRSATDFELPGVQDDPLFKQHIEQQIEVDKKERLRQLNAKLKIIRDQGGDPLNLGGGMGSNNPWSLSYPSQTLPFDPNAIKNLFPQQRQEKLNQMELDEVAQLAELYRQAMLKNKNDLQLKSILDLSKNNQ